MITVPLNPTTEAALIAEAKQRGTTPELLAAASLQARFGNGHDAKAADHRSLAELLGSSIGCLDSGSAVQLGSRLSEETGRQFAAGRQKKRQDGKL